MERNYRIDFKKIREEYSLLDLVERAYEGSVHRCGREYTICTADGNTIHIFPSRTQSTAAHTVYHWHNYKNNTKGGILDFCMEFLGATDLYSAAEMVTGNKILTKLQPDEDKMRAMNPHTRRSDAESAKPRFVPLNDRAIEYERTRGISRQVAERYLQCVEIGSLTYVGIKNIVGDYNLRSVWDKARLKSRVIITAQTSARNAFALFSDIFPNATTQRGAIIVEGFHDALSLIQLVAETNNNGINILPFDIYCLNGKDNAYLLSPTARIPEYLEPYRGVLQKYAWVAVFTDIDTAGLDGCKNILTNVISPNQYAYTISQRVNAGNCASLGIKDINDLLKWCNAQTDAQAHKLRLAKKLFLTI